jgi:acyl dehydratase
VISAVRTSLKPDLNVADKGGAGERPQPVIEDPTALRLLSEYTLTPERVKAYSMEGNSIHYEQEAAEQAGFRAPLIGGGMGVHYLTAEMWRSYKPRAFSADIYFRRPIFWDESVSVGIQEGSKSHWTAMAVLKQGKAVKVGTEIALRDLIPG